MGVHQGRTQGRREFLATSAMLAAGLGLAALPRRAASQAGPAMRIGIIGAGRVGGSLGRLWVQAGHEVMFSARHLEPVRALVADLGPKAHVGTPQEAATFGQVVVVSVPYAALPGIGRDLASALQGKVVLDTSNPIPARDGDMALAARAKGSGVASAEYLPGVRLVRAFNTVPSGALKSQAHRTGERVGVPLAADDAGALQTAARLTTEAGFEPVPVGPLSRAKDFDPGTRVFGKALPAGELRRDLGIGS